MALTSKLPSYSYSTNPWARVRKLDEMISSADRAAKMRSSWLYPKVINWMNQLAKQTSATRDFARNFLRNTLPEEVWADMLIQTFEENTNSQSQMYWSLFWVGLAWMIDVVTKWKYLLPWNVFNEATASSWPYIQKIFWEKMSSWEVEVFSRNMDSIVKSYWERYDEIVAWWIKTPAQKDLIQKIQTQWKQAYTRAKTAQIIEDLWGDVDEAARLRIFQLIRDANNPKLNLADLIKLETWVDSRVWSQSSRVQLRQDVVKNSLNTPTETWGFINNNFGFLYEPEIWDALSLPSKNFSPEISFSRLDLEKLDASLQQQWIFKDLLNKEWDNYKYFVESEDWFTLNKEGRDRLWIIDNRKWPDALEEEVLGWWDFYKSIENRLWLPQEEIVAMKLASTFERTSEFFRKITNC